MAKDAEFLDDRLVEVYDAECPWSRDDDFFLRVIDRRGPSRVVDLGCGTGRLALGAAVLGHTVTGVDPAPAMLDAARAKPHADRVEWILGTSEMLSTSAYETALMTSHVAQNFVSDDSWNRVLVDLHRSLRPAGILAFDSRDPMAQKWDSWNPADSRRSVKTVRAQTVIHWTEVDVVVPMGEGTTVTFTHHYEFADTELLSTSTIRFRSAAEIRDSLYLAGFTVTDMFGGWNHEPVGEGDGELLVLARVD